MSYAARQFGSLGLPRWHQLWVDRVTVPGFLDAGRKWLGWVWADDSIYQINAITLSTGSSRGQRYVWSLSVVSELPAMSGV